MRLTNESIVAGVPVAVPMMDIHTVGAGGGSIARVDEGGSLRVGPESRARSGSGLLWPFVSADSNRCARGAGPLSGRRVCWAENSSSMSCAAREALNKLAADMSAAAGEKLIRSRRRTAFSTVVTRKHGARAAPHLGRARTRPARIRFDSVWRRGRFACGGLWRGRCGFPRVMLPASPGALSAVGVLLADVVKRSKPHGNAAKLRRSRRRNWIAFFVKWKLRPRATLRREGFSRTAAKTRTLAGGALQRPIV